MKLSFKMFIFSSAVALCCSLLISSDTYFLTTLSNPTTNLNSSNKAVVDKFVSGAAVQANKMLKIVATDEPPVLSETEAFQVVQNAGIPWAFGGFYKDRRVSVSPIYGLATLGFAGDTSNIYTSKGTHPTGACANWIGPCNFPILKCNLGKCLDTGRVIERFENRPVWIIDYGNILWQNGGTGSVAPASNHAVYLIDALEKAFIVAWGYQSDKHQPEKVL
ncbi:MAG: hypothetical protein J0I20_31450 [Chloroflexi bacterium]|nr:hypothetical protein [Chloroflexota bacterium]OJV94013.1 MAG: hypothetical protein BGO39_06745 [Chloroflexi bacterium 54-19]